MLVQVSTKEYSSVSDFIRHMKLEDEFKKKYSVSIDNWEHEISDIEVIAGFLAKMEGRYIVDYCPLSDTIIVIYII